jgi:hypothetical protein
MVELCGNAAVLLVEDATVQRISFNRHWAISTDVGCGASSSSSSGRCCLAKATVSLVSSRAQRYMASCLLVSVIASTFPGLVLSPKVLPVAQTMHPKSGFPLVFGDNSLVRSRGGIGAPTSALFVHVSPECCSDLRSDLGCIDKAIETGVVPSRAAPPLGFGHLAAILHFPQYRRIHSVPILLSPSFSSPDATATGILPPPSKK